MTNSGSTSAARKRGLGGRATEARPPVAAVRPSPCWKSSPRPRGAVVVATGCLRGRPRPRLGGVEAGSTWRAFPFSAAENLLDGAMKKKEKQGGMNWKGARRSVLMAGEVQPSTSTIAGNHDPLCMQGLVQSVQLPRRRGEVETPTSNQLPRCPRPQAVRAHGASLLPFRLPARPSPGAPWARGLLSAFWERGSPDLPACGPRRGYASRPIRPTFINKAFKTLARGQASRGGRCKTSSGAASPGRLTRSGDIKAGQTSRGSGDVSHDDRHQAGTRRAPARVASLFPLWC